ncbi:MAG TPA: hypothetical protein VKO18_20235 [Terriglobia bacterium]|nr:hypothetical protein [Terriglobia bacterium]
MKRLTVLAFLLSFGVAWGQQTPPASTEQVNSPPQTPPAAQVQTEPLELAPAADLPHPEMHAVAFLPLQPGHSKESVAFVVAPNGKDRYRSYGEPR